ncbi:ferredoxin [Sphingosinicella sp. BN140058]|uniref:ferredoxin n=1 Tax=Sphingosinicella sp. BN140058 TaxID=1892855 RepID=UPI001011D98C|nr:ferredoxin [Sphingosinicella sp. BN140058]QAY77791.1 ferredoxin [Sphingosinicella sp. BN140058]
MPSQVPDAAPGPFYVDPNCCILCGIPEDIAPELFSTGEAHCFFIKQPIAPAEVDKTIEVMLSSEVDCIRYGGDDAAILKRMGRAGVAEFADDMRAAGYSPIAKDQVEFSADRSATEMAVAFRAFLRAQEGFKVALSFRKTKVRFAWWRGNFHTVAFELTDGRHRLILHPGHPDALLGVARVVGDWLQSDPNVGAIAWKTRRGDEDASPETPLPF